MFESLEAKMRTVAREELSKLEAERECQPERWLTSKHAADYLDMSLGRLHNLTSAGRIPVHREGGRLLFRRSELDEWVSSGRAAA